MVERQRRERFESVYYENVDAIAAYALRRADREAAKDVISETFLVAWRRLDEMPADAGPWLYGVARKVLANQRRTAVRVQALEERLARERQVWSASDPAPDAGRLREALLTLREPDQEVLMLVAWEELDATEAAAALGCTRASFAVRLHRARRRLAHALAAEGDDDGSQSAALQAMEAR
jgi:RNA polymerase sigma-70 factor, ECF subfamily